MCLYPRLIWNPKYKANKKNGGIIPAVNDNRVLYVPIGCGDCIECRKQKAREWKLRLAEDIKTNTNGKFITLTFSNESIKHLCNLTNSNITGYELDNRIATIAVRLFLERWRKKYKKSLRHWLITELGQNGTENIHLHGIIWTNETKKTIDEIWKYGYTYIGNNKQHWVNEQTVNYIIKYVHKRDKKHKGYKPIILTSAGIGKNYTNTPQSNRNKYNNETTKDTYKNNKGYEIAMPNYWRNKIYTDNEKEQLWIHKLNKNERWICGEKVKADDTKTIQALHNHYRKLNAELGYGNGKQNHNRQEYEQMRRKLLQEKRVSAFGPK